MVKKIKAFVVGFPIYHSLSPYIHRYWLDFYNIEGSYEACEISQDNFSEFITSIKEQGFVGGNVTLPHKEQAFKFADYSDENAKSIGAANSLWFEKGVLCAGNSDIQGFTHNLDDFAPNWREGKIAFVLGAGGAARAVIFALKQAGFNSILVSNRTRERAEQIAHHFGKVVKIINWQEIQQHINKVDLIVNTTSIGLADTSIILPFDFKNVMKKTIVTDIVYNPLETPFLQAANRQGLKTVDGFGMLLHQAVFGFERWFGVKPTVDGKLRELILSKFNSESEYK